MSALGKLLTKAKERLSPARESYWLFEDLGVPHKVVATIYTYPFRHMVIDGFLPEKDYEKIRSEFARIRDKGLSQSPDLNRLSRFDLYDLYAQVPRPTLDLPFGRFFSKTYFEAVESALRCQVTRDTFMTFHHHEPNPEDNYIHSDYVYEYFADDPLSNGVNPWYYQCEKFNPSEKGRPVVRAAAAIYYLDNGWQEGQGGETAIFASKDPASLVRKLAPLNNRLIVFDITPTSFHSYLRCSMPSRNSLAQWFYTTEESALARFKGIRPGGWDHLHSTREKA